MFNCEKPLPKDRAEMAKRVRASLFHEERKKRIFDPATRIIGVSYSYLILICYNSLVCLQTSPSYY